MRSINIKRAAAVAAGAAMIAGAITPALATQMPDASSVNSLVSSIKTNLTATEVVIGTTAQASDAVQGGKIAAVLATLNYEPTTIDTVTPTVTVTTTAGVTPGLSDTEYKFKQFGDLAATTKTINEQVMSELFSSHEFTTSRTSGTVEFTETIRYEDSLAIDGSKLTTKYYEKTGSYGTYTDINKAAMVYTIDFTKGDGVNISNTATYSPLPEVQILGKTYTLDNKVSTLTKLIFYAGGQYTFTDTDKVETVDDYTITADFIDATSATFTVAKGDLSETFAITEGSYHDFFAGTDNKFTIHLSNAQSNFQGAFAIATMGAGKLELENGKAYQEDETWKVGITTDGTDQLQTVTLTLNKDYLTTSTTYPALEMGSYFDGPVRLDGTIPFQFGIAGYSEADTTPVTFSTGDNVIQVKWMSQDGKEQDLTATREELNLSASAVNISVGEDFPYTIINNKIVEWAGYETTGSTRYVKFKVDGVENKFALTGVNASLTWNLPNDDSLTCGVVVDDASSPTMATIAYQATVCDTYADAVQIGNSIVFENVPTLNLANIKATAPMAVISIPVKSTYGNTGANNTVINKTIVGVYFDNATTTEGDADDDMGLYVRTPTALTNGVAINDATVANSTNWNTTSTKIDLSKATINENDKYEVILNNTNSYYAATVDGTDGETVTFTIPEKARDYVLNLRAEGTEGSEGTVGSQTVGVGDTVSGVTIDSINANTASGTYYTQVASGLQPQDLVVLDSAASATYKIVVGGPFVNSIAAGMTAGDMVKEIGASYVYAEGNNLLVAGYSATDTVNAANELIGLLTA